MYVSPKKMHNNNVSKKLTAKSKSELNSKSKQVLSSSSKFGIPTAKSKSKTKNIYKISNKALIPKVKIPFKSLACLKPELVRDKIFVLLDEKSRLAARLVCRKWRDLIDQTSIFQIVLDEHNYSKVKALSGIKQKVSHVYQLTVGFFSQPYPSTGFQFKVKRLTLLSVFNNQLQLNERMMPILEVLLLPEETLESLFCEFCVCEKLTLASSALSTIHKDSLFLKFLTFPNLTNLNLTAEMSHGIDAVQILLEKHFQNLLKFAIITKNGNDFSLYAEIYGFVGRHPKLNQFKQVTIGCSTTNMYHLLDIYNNNDAELQKQNDLLNCSKDFIPDLAAYDQILENLSNVSNLSQLDLTVSKYEGILGKKFQFQLLSYQTNLTVLNLINLGQENAAIWKILPTLLKTQCSTLKKLILDGCFCKSKSISFPCHWLQNCSQLEVLELLICGLKVADIQLLPHGKLKCLSLGQMLTQKQMRFIGSSFMKLEELSWPQLNVGLGVYGNQLVRKTDASQAHLVHLWQVKRACKLPKLKRLTLSTKSCKLKSIRRFVSGLMGIYEDRLPVSKKGDMELVIDRKLFVCPE